MTHHEMHWPLGELSLAERGRLISRVIAPRPIAFVSSLSAAGIGNLAPFSFFTAGGSNPPALVFCAINNRHGVPKHTVINVAATQEFVVNVVTREMLGQVNQASYEYGEAIDEFDLTGLTRAPSVVVAPPGVGESPVRLECKLHAIHRVGQGPSASNFVIGEIVHVSAAASVCTDGLPDNHKIGQLSRLGADLYLPVTPGELFSLARPTTP
jgi:flavin reductase (DIM6/NTAB) family NADH-FMN oxidoreductase RutF